jgi:hypothetical protein
MEKTATSRVFHPTAKSIGPTPALLFSRKSEPKISSSKLIRSALAAYTSTPAAIDYKQCEEPDEIRVRYSSDLDIRRIDETVQVKFRCQEAQIDRYRQALTEEETTMKTVAMTVNQRRLHEQQILELQQKIDDIESGRGRQLYTAETKDLLEEYSKYCSLFAKGIITIGSGGKKMEDEATVKHRLKIIEQYLVIASRYINITYTKVGSTKARCPGCDTDFSKTHVDVDNGLCTCSNCGFERENLSMESHFRDAKRVNIGGRNNYDDIDNFRRKMDKFQGKGKSPPDKIYEQLDEYFSLIKKPSGEAIRKLPLLPNGKKTGTNKLMLITALSETNNSAYYEDANLIAHEYWGWELPDLSTLEAAITDIYIRTQKVYEEIPNKGREAAMNTEVRLFLILKGLNYKGCHSEIEDFKFPTSHESLEFHQEMWWIMCQETDFKYHPLL